MGSTIEGELRLLANVFRAEVEKARMWREERNKLNMEFNKEDWLICEKGDASRAISKIKVSGILEVYEERHNLIALWLYDEYSPNRAGRGDSIDTLDGAAKIVSDWGKEQGFIVTVESQAGSCDDSALYLNFRW